MARQDHDSAQHLLVLKIGLLGAEADGIRIDQFGVGDRVVVDARKRCVYERTLDRFDAEERILAGNRPPIGKMRVAADFESVGELVSRNLRPRLSKQWLELECAWIELEQAFEDKPQD